MSNGTVQPLIEDQSTGNIYLNLFNEYWLIADPPTLTGVFGNPSITTVSTLPSGSTLGPEIGDGSGLWLTPQGPIYFICTGAMPVMAYWITSEAALSYYQFNGVLQQCSNATINGWLASAFTYGQNIVCP